MLAERNFTVTAPGCTTVTVHYAGRQVIVNLGLPQ